MLCHTSDTGVRHRTGHLTMGTRQTLLLLLAVACAHAVPLSGKFRGVSNAHAQAVPLSELLRKGEHPSRLLVCMMFASCNSDLRVRAMCRCETE